MKKQISVEKEEFNSILPEYGRRKLLTYADSIRELAESFRETENNREEIKRTVETDRKDYIWQKRLNENKDLMIEHFAGRRRQIAAGGFYHAGGNGKNYDAACR